MCNICHNVKYNTCVRISQLFTPTVPACPPLFPPENGAVVFPGSNVEDVATYSCDEGFSLIGSNTRICGANGEWWCEQL